MVTKYPSWGKPMTLEQIGSTASFAEMHPTMRQRVLQLIEASDGKVGLGEGVRSEAAQRTLFLSRYEVAAGGSVQFEGQRWRKKNPKLATAAPPGRSMHEVGLATDLAGDHKWVVANSSQFALKHFAWVNNEPWHVQPFELPNSRRQYEQSGSPWRPGSGIIAPVVVAEEPAPHIDGTSRLEVVPGMRGPAVGELQDVLIRLGLIKDSIANRDEFYGPATVEVVTKFQANRGLKQDGKVGPKTWAALLG